MKLRYGEIGCNESTTVEILYQFETIKSPEARKISTTVEILYQFETFKEEPEEIRSTTVEILYQFET